MKRHPSRHRTSPSAVAWWILTLLLTASAISAASHKPTGITYVSPRPNAQGIRPESNIILRSRTMLRAADVEPGDVRIEGSASGRRHGTCVLSDDLRTIVITQAEPFAPGEKVTVEVSYALVARMAQSAISDPFVFQFEIAAPAPATDPFASIQCEVYGLYSEQTFSRALGDTLPIDFPYIDTEILDETAPGRMFISNVGGGSSAASYLAILENSGQPFFYRKNDYRGYDFKLQPNGLLTFYESASSCFYALNDAHEVVDSFRCGNGYTTDVHDLQILPNGHALLMSYDGLIVDMSEVVPGGHPEARVWGLIIQELDTARNVVFQWRSWDHFSILDATRIDFSTNSIDYVHGNAVELDADGNILISSRHLDEITKISRETGDVIWRWGGKNNEFTFVNDSIGFFRQHDIRRLPSGNVTLFDNGNFHDPPFSRAVEYRLDEINKTAELVWQYRETPDIYGSAMGNVQRLENGNTVIGWGTGSTVTEVRPDGSKVFDLKLAQGVFTYRAFRFEWKPEILPGPSDLPSEYALSQNYPNPFNVMTTISVGLPEHSQIRLAVVDQLGREIQRLFDGVQRSGEFVARFDGSKLASGVYYYRLEATSVSEPRTSYKRVRRMVLMK